MKPGELFATFHTAEVFLNRVTSSYRDRQTHPPEYKVAAVQIEPVQISVHLPGTGTG